MTKVDWVFFLNFVCLFFIRINYLHVLLIRRNVCVEYFTYARPHTNLTVINITSMMHTHVYLRNHTAGIPNKILENIYELLTATVAYVIKWKRKCAREWSERTVSVSWISAKWANIQGYSTLDGEIVRWCSEIIERIFLSLLRNYDA